MARHFHLLVGQRGEHFACLTFRKVANWYCRVLKPGRDIQQRLMMLERVADFDAIVAYLRDQGPPPNWKQAPSRKSRCRKARSPTGDDDTRSCASSAMRQAARQFGEMTTSVQPQALAC